RLSEGPDGQVAVSHRLDVAHVTIDRQTELPLNVAAVAHLEQPRLSSHLTGQKITATGQFADDVDGRGPGDLIEALLLDCAARVQSDPQCVGTEGATEHHAAVASGRGCIETDVRPRRI